jgi:hypothetical protein
MSHSSDNIEAIIRENGRGGWEIAEPAMPVGSGLGNYPTSGDAYAVACYSFEPERIRVLEQTTLRAPRARLRQKSKIEKQKL